MSKVREVLTRDGIVQTFLQIPDIAKIRFTVAGQPLKDSRNQEIGDMTDSTFVAECIFYSVPRISRALCTGSSVGKTGPSIILYRGTFWLFLYFPC